ncbi:unnamed protein product [Effrenium voratum]|nr:unnamed protein product [Effrenium voratum]
MSAKQVQPTSWTATVSPARQRWPTFFWAPMSPTSRAAAWAICSASAGSPATMPRWHPAIVLLPNSSQRGSTCSAQFQGAVQLLAVLSRHRRRLLAFGGVRRAPTPARDVEGDPGCVGTVMKNWKETAAIATAKGYKFLSTPLVAENLDFAKQFIEHACGCSGGSCSCQDASCGCPVYVGFHFYAYDCQPDAAGGYETLQKRLDAVKAIMEQYPFVKGAIINEVGMLNCASEDLNPICVPDSGKYPASKTKDHSCPVTDELPNGMATFIEKIFDHIIAARTKDGREVVKAFSWFNQDRAGGTYNLRLFDDDGSINQAGEAYMTSCQRWRR